MTIARIFVPRDAGALALGADEVERAIIAAERRRGIEVDIVRTGSRGLYWLELMIEVTTAQGRIAYGPVSARDVEELFAAGFLDGGPHPLRLGRPEELPFLKRQRRFTCACSATAPLAWQASARHSFRMWRPAGAWRKS